MKLSPSLVAVKKISSQVPATSFSEDAIAQAAQLILELEGVINPIIVKRTSLESYEVIDGDFEYYAAAKAREINPRKGEMIGAFIVEEENENVLREQVKRFRHNRQDSQLNSIDTSSEVDGSTNNKLESFWEKVDVLTQKFEKIEAREETGKETNNRLEILLEKIELLIENKNNRTSVNNQKNISKTIDKSPYDKMKVEELKQILKDKGVKVKSKTTKTELIKLIEENR